MWQQKEKKESGWHPNRSYIQLNYDIVIDSCFPGGNVARANLLSYSPLTIEVEGNTDISFDTLAKYWLYFRIRGYKREKQIKFILKNANHLRKFIGQSKYRPYMVYKEGQEQWQPVLNHIDIIILENSQIQGNFIFQSQKYTKQKKTNKSVHDLHLTKQQKTTAISEDTNKGNCYFAIYYPYSYDDLGSFLLKMNNRFSKDELMNEKMQKMGNKVYFNEETVVYSYERRKVSLITITSVNNIDSFSERQSQISEEIFPYPKDRPFKLKNNPIIMLSARVHPSETSSSYFIQGLVEFLTSNTKASMILRQLFIFQIIPMLNPDGVEHGNFRFDHQLKNLNRYYGQSSIEKTPSIRAAELLINYFKNNHSKQVQSIQFESCNRLFMYADVHGHSSPVPSFIYGNHTDRVEHMIENKLFCKLIEANFIQGGFSKNMSQFSKKNMTIQEKYDDFSKLCSGRVFAGMPLSHQESTFHSYTMEVLPYSEEYLKRKNDKVQRISAIEYARSLGKVFAISILDILNINPEPKISDQQIQKFKKIINKECLKEQSRNTLLFKRTQINDRNSYSELSKPKNAIFQRQSSIYDEYVSRWFNNEQLVKNIFERPELVHELKLSRLFASLAYKFKLHLPISVNNFQSRAIRNQNSQTKRNRMDTEKIMSELSSPHKKTNLTIQEEERPILIFKQREKNKIQTKINKQTLELREDYLELITKFKTPDEKYRNLAIKRQFVEKDHLGATQRYEKEVLMKMNEKIIHNNAIKYQREKKERKSFKSKMNPRLQTETITSESNNRRQMLSSEKVLALHSNADKHLLRQNSSPNRGLDRGLEQPNIYNLNFRSSLIEQFLEKTQEQRSHPQMKQLGVNEALKTKMLKYQSSIKDQLQEQEKKMLPVLRRNKVFTMIGTNSNILECSQWKNYNSIHPSRKRANTLEQDNNIEQAIFKTKKLLAIHKKQEIIRQKTKKPEIIYDFRP